MLLRRTIISVLAVSAAASAVAKAAHKDVLPHNMVFDPVARLPAGFLGELVPSSPIMTPLDQSFDILRMGFRVRAVSEMSFRSVILSRRRYFFDRFRISPMDLVLGWGALSNPSVFRSLRVSTSRPDIHVRKTSDQEFDPELIMSSMSLFHIIPSRISVWDDLSRLRRNNIVDLSGFLCEVTDLDGERHPYRSVSASGTWRYILLVEAVSLPVIT